MLVTEEEAYERWCPFARTAFPLDAPAVAANRFLVEDNRPEGVPRCVASQCMAWRWQPLQADQAFLDAVKARMAEGETMSKATKYVRANLAELGLPDKSYRGICGLAGELMK